MVVPYKYIRRISEIVATFAIFFALPSCRPMTPDEQFIRQKIPVQVQNGRTVTIDIDSLSGNGGNDVGIRCPPELWNLLTNSTKSITARLRDSSRPDTSIDGVNPDHGGAFFGYLTNVHYLFVIGGRHHSKATVEISFPNGPEKETPAEIIVGKTPADTCAPW
jgi:hypothetical protein